MATKEEIQMVDYSLKNVQLGCKQMKTLWFSCLSYNGDNRRFSEDFEKNVHKSVC